MVHIHIIGIYSLYMDSCARRIVHKTEIKSNSSGQGRTLFIKSYIFGSVLSDYTQSYRIQSLQSYEEYTNNLPVARMLTCQLQFVQQRNATKERCFDRRVFDRVMRENRLYFSSNPSSHLYNPFIHLVICAPASF